MFNKKSLAVLLVVFSFCFLKPMKITRMECFWGKFGYAPKYLGNNKVGLFGFFLRCRNNKVAKKVLQDMDDVDSFAYFGDSPLSLACSGMNFDLVKWLVEKKGSDVNRLGFFGGPILHDACRQPQVSKNSSSDVLKIVKFLVEKGVDASVTCDYGEKPVCCACQYGYLDVAKFLIEVDDSFDLMNDGLRILHRACYDGKIDVVYFILDLCKKRGIDIVSYLNKRRNGTALDCVLRSHRIYLFEQVLVEVAKILIVSGADVNETAWRWCGRSLVLCAGSRQLVVASVLVDHGADISKVCIVKDMSGKLLSPIDWIAKQEKDKLLKEHIEYLKRALDSKKGHWSADLGERLQAVDELMCNSQTPIYTKQTAIPCLFKVYKELPRLLSKEKMISYFNQIIFNQRFLTEPEFKDAVVFASKNHCKDTFYSSVLVAAVRFCEEEKIGPVLATILSENPLIYKNEAMFRRFLKEYNASCREALLDNFKVLVHPLIRKMHSAEYKKSERYIKMANDFINALHLAKSMGRKKVFRLLANRSMILDALKKIEILGEFLPDEIVAHIASFLRNEKSLYCKKTD